ncbi:hypothetical protein [Fodinibius sp. Rm-B-1B1-1]|uniref:hypothetical protein n=1 Tax=Fodinibius alkaliphilus TaxID=3140241 RepID=UPI003159F492
MKLKTILIILLFTFHNVANGQSAHEASNIGKVGITISSLSNNDVTYFKDVVGSAGYNGKNFFSIGLNYIHPLKNWLEVETAVEYSEFTMEVNPPFYPGINNESYNTEVALLDIPVTLRANFLEYFYANSGVLLDIDVSNSNAIDDQSGIGGTFGVGAKYDLGFGASIFINPYFKMHSIIPFSQEGSMHQRLTESAIRFGFTYQL